MLYNIITFWWIAVKKIYEKRKINKIYLFESYILSLDFLSFRIERYSPLSPEALWRKRLTIDTKCRLESNSDAHHPQTEEKSIVKNKKTVDVNESEIL